MLIDVINSVWALRRQELDTVLSVYRNWKNGIVGEIQDVVQQDKLEYETQGNVAIIPIQGILAKKINLLQKISGGTSTQLISRDIQAALDDTEVETIILKIDSPGGSVDGVETLAGQISEAAKTKRIIAYVDGLAASAAYWLASSANEIYVSEKTAFVGSIGVYQIHVDESESEKMDGVKTTVIRAGKYKAFPDGYEALTNEGKEILQDEVDKIYSIFVNAVAKNRGLDVAAILAQHSKVFISSDAVELGLIDGIINFSELIGKETNTMSEAIKDKLGDFSAKIDEKVNKAEYEKLLQELELMRERQATSDFERKIETFGLKCEKFVSEGKMTPAEYKMLKDFDVFLKDDKLVFAADDILNLFNEKPKAAIFQETVLPTPKSTKKTVTDDDLKNMTFAELTAKYRAQYKDGGDE